MSHTPQFARPCVGEPVIYISLSLPLSLPHLSPSLSSFSLPPTRFPPLNLPLPPLPLSPAPPCQITPSTDPLRTDLRLDRSDVTLLELPGGHKARAVWHLHYPQAHALVFVVDASDHERLKEVASVLSSVLRHPRMAGKPLLILANKQDRASALIPSEVIESLSLETLVNENKTLCRIEPCCAGTDFNSHHDWSILKGLRWALRSVTINYPTLSARVLQETAEQRDSHRRSMRAPGRTHGDR
ncbi:hypothetical protein FKM82_002402 [Ascaphus truei]